MTWFLGAGNYFSHSVDDSAGHRLALATLMANGHARPSQIQKTLGTPRAPWCAGANNTTRKAFVHWLVRDCLSHDRRGRISYVSWLEKRATNDGGMVDAPAMVRLIRPWGTIGSPSVWRWSTVHT